ncbi:MAG: Ig-like domain-containing protein [Bacteroidales bacterium]|nr:Ig-like domain-containing protein [Bacteroidales bacterium]
MKRTIITVILTALGGIILNAQQLAFPTAEGYGKYTAGGRGGAVYEVINLNATGPGSLGAAIAASGPRTVVFLVSGTIEGNFRISNDKITIAGQTAPGDGICIKGSINVSANDVIIRYIRVRLNPDADADAIGGRYRKNIIIDHVSASWSSDEVMSFYHNEYVTIQWCMITEGCAKFKDGINTGHRFGGIWGNNYGTYHHNLIAHNDSRNPRWASGSRYNDYRNNVLYNWGYQSCYGGEAQQEGHSELNFSTINMIANYYKAGPATQYGVKDRIAEPSARSADDKGSWYVAGNYVNGYPAVTADNWMGIDGSSYIKLSAPWDAMPIDQETPEDAYNAVLAQAGCSKPNRDAIDTRIIQEVASGTATYGNNGIITYPSDVGGWSTLASGTVPVDSDHDGMPDSWEIANGLDTANAADRNNISPDGYTMLENYLNSLAVYTPVSVTGVKVNPDSVSVEKNKTTKLSYIISPANVTNQSVTWSSNDITIATVDESGVVKGIDSGTAVITVTTKDGGFTDTCIVEVFTIPVAGVSIDPSEATLNIYEIKKLVAIIEPINATNKEVTWSSSDTSVVKVASTGYIVAKSSGSVMIFVTTQDGNFTDSCMVTVTISSYSPAPSAEKVTVNCFPNPFSDEIHFEIPVQKPQKVLVELFDINGKKIATIADRTFETGINAFIWNTNDSGFNLKPGVYIVSITSGTTNIIKELTLIRK